MIDVATARRLLITLSRQHCQSVLGNITRQHHAIIAWGAGRASERVKYLYTWDRYKILERFRGMGVNLGRASMGRTSWADGSFFRAVRLEVPPQELRPGI